MEDTTKGSCHCGKVTFEITNRPGLTVNCHCDDCKKRNGGAFSTYLAVTENSFRITEGEAHLKKYAIEDSGEKYFCAECGSPIYNKNYRIPGMYMVPCGVCARPDQYTPSFNVFCSTRLAWVNEIENMTSFQDAIER